jgi:hypothetical protein
MGGDTAMGKRHQSEDNETRRSADASRTYDPLQPAWSQTGKFNAAWLKNGEHLTVLERSGYTVMSLLFVAFGLYFLRFFVLMFRGGDWVFTSIFGGATFFFMMIGIMGLRNVLRFPARP